MDAPAFNDLYDSGGVAKLQRPRSLSKNAFSTKLSEVKGAAKASKPHSSAYSGTVEGGLRSKSKHLAQQAVFAVLGNAASYICDVCNDKGTANHQKLCFDGWRLF